MHFIHLHLHGRVQGVGYRAFVLHRAREHGVRGEVRNTPDGGVQVIAEGELAAVEAFLADARRGPTLARIDDEQLDRGERAARFRGFGIAG